MIFQSPVKRGLKMKNRILVGLGMSALAANFALAQEAKPCKNIHAACSAAGYIKGHHKEGKGLWKDCINPILAGQSVAGVTVNSADVQACQAKKASKKAK
jgi:hypothetical protein